MNVFDASANDNLTVVVKAMVTAIDRLTKNVKGLSTAMGHLKSSLMAQNAMMAAATLSASKTGEALKGVGDKAEDAGRKAKKAFDPGPLVKWASAISIAKSGFTFAKETAGRYVRGQLEKGENFLKDVVESAQLREDTMVALKDSIRGSEDQKKKASEELYHFAAVAATKTPLDTDYLIERIKELTVAGYKPGETQDLIALIADQQTEFKGQTGEVLTEALVRMKAMGVVTNKEFRSLIAAKALNAGVFKNMAEALGVKETDETKLAMAVKKRISKGDVSAYTLINALIKEREDKSGKIGAFSVANSATLTGSLSNFKNAVGDLLKISDVTKWQGIKVFVDFLTRAQRLITDEKGVGGRLLAHMEKFVNSVFGGLANIKDEDITAYLDKIGEKLDWAAKGADAAWEMIDKVLHGNAEDTAKAWDWLGEKLRDVGHWLGRGIIEGILSILPKMSDLTQGLLKGILPKAEVAERSQAAYDKAKVAGGNATWAGIKEYVAPEGAPSFSDFMLGRSYDQIMKARQAGADLSKGAVEGMKDEGQIHSPSRVMAEQGRWLVRGLMAGVDKESSSGAGPTGGGNLELNVPVQVIDAKGMSADDLSRAILRNATRETTAIFERLAKGG